MKTIFLSFIICICLTINSLGWYAGGGYHGGGYYHGGYNNYYHNCGHGWGYGGWCGTGIPNGLGWTLFGLNVFGWLNQPIYYPQPNYYPTLITQQQPQVIYVQQEAPKTRVIHVTNTIVK